MTLPVFDAVCEAMGFDPKTYKPPVVKPTPQELKRAKRVTNRVLSALNRKEVPPPSSDTAAIMDDVTADPATPALTAEQAAQAALDFTEVV